MKPNRGVKVIAILNGVIGIIVFVAAAVLAASKASSIYVLIMALIAFAYLAIAYGLLKFQNWARILATIFFGIAIIEIIFLEFHLQKFTPLEITATVFKVVLSSLIIFYLNKKSTKVLFQK